MKIISVNIGKEKAIQTKSGKTGIYKDSTSDSAMIHDLGLANDVIVDTENHGGVDQAVYVYGTLDYDWWSHELNRVLEAGTFGENLTISDLESETLCIGDQLQIGNIVLEVTSPRIPCVTLATRMGDPTFVKRFVKAERFGAYCRVLQTGYIQQDDKVVLSRYDGVRLSINEMAQAFYRRHLEKAQLERLLSVPIAIRARTYYENELAQSLA